MMSVWRSCSKIHCFHICPIILLSPVVVDAGPTCSKTTTCRWLCSQPSSPPMWPLCAECDVGDLFHMRGQLSQPEVKVIMLQLLSTVQYFACSQAVALCAPAAALNPQVTSSTCVAS